MTSDTKILGLDKIKCSTCGASLVFSPDIGALKCEHCGNTVDITDKTIAEEKDFFSVNEDEWSGEACAYKCDSCHAVTVFPQGEIAGNCPFCGASIVIAPHELTGVKPNAVIPFGITLNQAKDCYKRWIKKKLYAPRKLKKDFVADATNGIYVPCWTYDTTTSSTYIGKFGEYYYVTVGSGKNRRTVRRTRWYTVSGVYDDAFDDIVIESGDKISQKQLQSVMPFSTKNAVKYDSGYLAGFRAERYSQGVKECYERAKSVMDAYIRRMIIARYHPDVVSYLNVSTTYSNITYKYLLLPVWLCSFNYRGKSYGFMVNGETGKTKGKAPVSWLKVLLTVLGAVAVIGTVVLLV